MSLVDSGPLVNLDGIELLKEAEEFGGSSDFHDTVKHITEGNYKMYVYFDKGCGDCELSRIHPNVKTVGVKFGNNSDGEFLTQLGNLSPKMMDGRSVLFDIHKGDSRLYMPKIMEYLKKHGAVLSGVFINNAKSPRHVQAIIESIPAGKNMIKTVGMFDTKVNGDIIHWIMKNLPGMEVLDLEGSDVDFNAEHIPVEDGDRKRPIDITVSHKRLSGKTHGLLDYFRTQGFFGNVTTLSE